MENDLPRVVSELLAFTAAKPENKAPMAERFPVFLQNFGPLPEPGKIVKVTGTNGKGSLCAMLEACLIEDKRRVGLFTSPHLSRINERFRINGVDVSDDVLNDHAARVLRLAEKVSDVRGDAFRPSFFESLILIALGIFSESRVDVMIFEAGVGGYNDAVSLLPGKFSAITSIGLDHRLQLGDTLEAIAGDKAGIASPGSFLILGPEISPSLRKIIEQDAIERGTKVEYASKEGLKASFKSLGCPTEIEFTAGDRLMSVELPLLGRHQVDNFSTLVSVVECLWRNSLVRDFACLAGVRNVRWPGRLDVRKIPPVFVFDAAHNEHGIKALVDSLSDIVPFHKRILLYGASADKDYENCLPHLSAIAPEVYLVEGFYRAEANARIESLLPAGCRFVQGFPTPAAAFEFFEENDAFSDKFVIATGSIFMIGELIARCDRRAVAGKSQKVVSGEQI